MVAPERASVVPLAQNIVSASHVTTALPMSVGSPATMSLAALATFPPNLEFVIVTVGFASDPTLNAAIAPPALCNSKQIKNDTENPE